MGVASPLKKKNNLVTFHFHKADPVFFPGHSGQLYSRCDFLPGMSVETKTHSRHQVKLVKCDPSLKVLEKWSVSWISPEIIWVLLPCALQEQEQMKKMEYCCQICTGDSKSSLSSLDSAQKASARNIKYWIILDSFFNPFLNDETLQAVRYSITIFIAAVQMKMIFFLGNEYVVNRSLTH